MIIYELPVKPASTSWQAVSNDSVNVSQFTGTQYVHSYSNQQWKLNLEFAPLSEEDAMLVQGMCNGLMDRRNAVQIFPLELSDSTLAGTWISNGGNLYKTQAYLGGGDGTTEFSYYSITPTTSGDLVIIPGQSGGNPFGGEFDLPCVSISILGVSGSQRWFIRNVSPNGFTFDKTDDLWSGALTVNPNVTFSSYDIRGNVFDDNRYFGASLLWPSKRSNFVDENEGDYPGRVENPSPNTPRPYSDQYNGKANAYFRLSDNFTFDIDVAKTIGITIPLEEYIQPSSTSYSNADNIYVNERDYKYYDGTPSFRGFYFYGTDTNTSATKGYYYPLFLDEDQAKACDYPVVNNTPDSSGVPTAREAHSHTFEEYPGQVFYMPSDNQHHAESSLGSVSTSIGQIDYDKILTRHWASVDNVKLEIQNQAHIYVEKEGSSRIIPISETEFNPGDTGGGY